MKSLKNPFIRFDRVPALVLVSVWAVSACSGSGDSTTTGSTQASAGSDISAVSGDGEADSPNLPSGEIVPSQPDISSGANVPSEPSEPNNSENETVLDATKNPDTEVSPAEPESGNPVVADPVVKSTIPVAFEITVPAYQSDSLRVELVWGDVTLLAKWVGDEYWSASGEFATQTEHPLTVTFYDLNGELELASFIENYKTGENVIESMQISVEDFDSSIFDKDQDGISNLDELLAGTDPYAEAVETEQDVRSFYVIGSYSRMSVSQNFESRISSDRPLYVSLEEPTLYDKISVYTDIDIDENGNGTLSYRDYSPTDKDISTGTRTRSGNAVSWEGERYTYLGDYHHNVSFTNTVTVVDDKTRTIVEELNGSNIGTYNYTWESSINLTGKLIEGTSLCEPVAGTVTVTYRRRPQFNLIVTTISKEADDSRWSAIVEETTAVYSSDTGSTRNVMKTRNFVAQDLKLYRSRYAPDDTEIDQEDSYFICDFPDI